MFDRLDRYVARTFLSSWLVSVVFFAGLFAVVDFFGSVQELLVAARERPEGAAIIGRFYLVQAPVIVKEVAPFVMLMAALFTVQRLQRHNELMAMLLVGRSARRVMLPVLLLTAVAVGGLVWLQEGVAPRVSVERERLRQELLKGRKEWVIDAIDVRDAQGRMVSARGFHVSAGTIDRLYVSGRDGEGHEVVLGGTNARWSERLGGWRVDEGRGEIRLPGRELPVATEVLDVVRTDVRPEDLLADRRQPFDLSWAEVLDRSERYPQAASYRLLRHYHVTYPLSVLLLVLLGLPFVLKGPRGSLGGVGISIMLCLAYLVVDATVRDLGNRGFLEPVLAAWLPVILAGSLGVVLFEGIDS